MGEEEGAESFTYFFKYPDFLKLTLLNLLLNFFSLMTFIFAEN